MVTLIFISIWFGIFGYLMAEELTEPGEVFGWLPSLVHGKDLCAEPSFFRYFLSKITWNCSKCIAGFWCFWCIFVSESIKTPDFDFELLKVFTIAFMCAIIAAFVAIVLTKLLINK